ncbi:PAQR family membrane homeostasis protein TrhA [Bordetella genomosp. 13]|uniref:PAQR family membrane homeostasis protein TrhA n=1 Tax=Bordetella genomosp. 13 TaxID=463040 RepID=UPI0011A20924|nr:hemolysin III family protein [Bordetella genomosp. 13]
MYHGERFNSWSHLIGLVLAMASAAALLPYAIAESGNAWHVVSCAVFAAAAVATYAASTIYHCCRGARKNFWERVDHCTIYILIAGTYTPLGLIPLEDDWGWLLAGGAWLLAAIGIVREIVGRHRAAAPAVGLYVAMGWLGVLMALPIVQHVPTAGLAWLVAGALLYSAGLVFYRNSAGWTHAHGVWHLFTIAGTACHSIMVWTFLD